MNGLSRLMLALSLSVGIAVLLSFLPKLEQDARQADVQVIYELTGYNLVDHLQAVPLSYDKDRVDWNGSTLAVDLKTSTLQIDAEALYHDFIVLGQMSFRDSSNVLQLRVRFLYKSPEGSTYSILAAMEAKRSVWDVKEASRAEELNGNKKSFLDDYSHLMLSRLWQNS